MQRLLHCNYNLLPAHPLRMNAFKWRTKKLSAAREDSKITVVVVVIVVAVVVVGAAATLIARGCKERPLMTAWEEAAGAE